MNLQLGGLRVDLLPEIAHRMVPVSFLFAELAEADMARNAGWLGPDLLDLPGRRLGFAFNAYVLRAEGMTILVDACNGNRKQRPTALWQNDLRATTFLDNLAALGLRVEDIDLVLCTHLHCDHVGWNTTLRDGRWQPTFPRARYVMNRAEFDPYAALLRALGPARVNHGAFADSVLPVVEAGQASFVDEAHCVLDDLGGRVALAPSPGHSPGHVSIHVEGGGQEAVICGDALHHPIQCDLPDLPMRVDADPGLAIRTRRALLAHCADTGAFLLAGHAAGMAMAAVRRQGEVFRMSALA